jgi:acyl-CoA synthetase (AMP-forming)/AMP-acid ligase II
MQGEHEFFGILKITEAKGIVVPGEFRGTDFVSMIGGLAGKLESLETLATVGHGQQDPGWVTFEGLLAEAPGEVPRPVPPITASDLALVLFTSGSAGDPKGVMHSSNTICALNTTVAPIYGLGSEDVIFMAAPLGFSAGYVHGLRLAIYLGATLVLQESWNADRALQTMVREKATFTLTTPTLLRDLMASPLFASHAARLSLRLVLCGGTYVPADLLRAANEGMPRTLTSVIWGMTEGIGTGSRPGTPLERVCETDGQPFLGTEFKVLAEDGGEAGPDEEGDLVMRGPQLCLGYFKRPEIDAETFLPGRWFRTGDVARVDAEGFVKITGRRKELIIRGGANLSPAEIESMLLGDPRIRELAVVGLPDERLGERVCACVVPGEGGGELTLPDIVEIARRRGLAKYKWPESLAFVDALPVSTVGKLQRRVLQEQVLKRIEAAAVGET